MKFRKIKLKLKSPRAMIRNSTRVTGVIATNHATKNCDNCEYNLNGKCNREYSSTYGEHVGRYNMCPIILLKDGYLKNIIRKLI